MTDSAPRRSRLGIYFELPYRRDESGFSTHIPFIRFVLALRPHFDGLVLIGRVDPEPGREFYAIPDDIEVAALPHYASLRDIIGIVSRLPETLRAIWHALGSVDTVWVIGPAPMSIPVAVLGLARKKHVVLGVRQDWPRYVGHRLGGMRWAPALGAAYILEILWRDGPGARANDLARLGGGCTLVVGGHPRPGHRTPGRAALGRPPRS